MTETAAFGLLSTIAAWTLARRLKAIVPHPLFDPVLVSVAALIGMLLLLDIPYADYDRGGSLIRALLDPAVVALALPLYRLRAELRRHLRAVGVSVTVGAAVGMLSAYGLVRLLGGSALSARSLVAKSVTTPIAIAITEGHGGVAPLTIFAVVVTGLLGGTVGPELARAVGVRGRLAIGLSVGTAAHGIGTARALRDHPFEGAMSGIGMTFAGLVTAALAPLVFALLGWLEAWASG